MSKTFKIVKIPPKPVIDQSWSLIQIVKTWQPYSWENVFKEAIEELEDVSTILEEQEKINGPYFPLKTNIFKAFELTRLSKVKVVIFGQDPYPQKLSSGYPRAQGLSFSVSQEDQIPVSLANIYRELEKTIDGFVSPCHGDLTRWAEQGVLMLNMCLTVQQGLPGSHGEIWLGFIKRVVDKLAEERPNVIYVMWGREAQKMKKIINNKSYQLEAPHPASRHENGGFIGCGHFAKINNLLTKIGSTPIDWRLD